MLFIGLLNNFAATFLKGVILCVHQLIYAMGPRGIYNPSNIIMWYLTNHSHFLITVIDGKLTGLNFDEIIA